MVKSCPIAKWSVIWMPFEYRTKFSLIFRPPFEYRTGIQMVVWIRNYHLNTWHLNNGQVKVRYSDVSIIKMFVIQIPTVIWDLLPELLQQQYWISPKSIAAVSVCWWKLPDPIFLRVVTLPSGVTPITRLEAEQASSSGVGSTTQWLPIRESVTY